MDWDITYTASRKSKNTRKAIVLKINAFGDALLSSTSVELPLLVFKSAI